MGNCHTIKCPTRVAENVAGIILSDDILVGAQPKDVIPTPEDNFVWVLLPAYHNINYACSNYPFEYQYQPINTEAIWVKLKIGDQENRLINTQSTDLFTSVNQTKSYKNFLPVILKGEKNAFYVSFDPKIDETIRCTKLSKDNSFLIVFCLTDDYSVNYQDPTNPSPFLPQLNIPVVEGPNNIIGDTNDNLDPFSPATLSYPDFINYIVSNYWRLVQNGQIEVSCDDKNKHHEECDEDSSSSKKDVSFSIPEEHNKETSKSQQKHKNHHKHHKHHKHH